MLVHQRVIQIQYSTTEKSSLSWASPGQCWSPRSTLNTFLNRGGAIYLFGSSINVGPPKWLVYCGMDGMENPMKIGMIWRYPPWLRKPPFGMMIEKIPRIAGITNFCCLRMIMSNDENMETLALQYIIPSK